METDSWVKCQFTRWNIEWYYEDTIKVNILQQTGDNERSDRNEQRSCKPRSGQSAKTDAGECGPGEPSEGRREAELRRAKKGSKRQLITTIVVVVAIVAVLVLLSVLGNR